MRAAIIIAVLALSATAHADTKDRKDPALAVTISVTATLGAYAIGAAVANQDERVGGALLVTSMVLAPSAGHLYAGDMNWIGLGIRAVGVGAVTYVVKEHGDCIFGHTDDGSTACQKYEKLLIGGLLAYAGGVVFDWVASADSARRVNRRRERMQLVPTVVSGPRSSGAGLGFAASF